MAKAKASAASEVDDAVLVVSMCRALVAIDDFMQAQRLPSDLAEKAHAVHEAVGPLRVALEKWS